VVRSVSAHPRAAGEADQVRATIETVHFSFEPRSEEPPAGSMASAQGER